MYEADLQTMVSIFFQQNVELHAQIIQIPGMRGSGNIRVMLVKGSIVACLIKSKGGEILSDTKALHIVERLGSLAWDYTPLTPEAASSNAPQQETSSRSASIAGQLFAPQEERAPTGSPQRTSFHSTFQLSLQPDTVLVRACTMPLRQFTKWSRLYRSVFNLVDGHNSIKKIANLLAKPYETVEKILSDLYMQGIVVRRSYPPGDSGRQAARTIPLQPDGERSSK